MPRAIRALFVVLSGFTSSPPAVPSLCGCCALFSFWFPLLQDGCASCLWCLGHTLASLFVQSLLPFIVGSPSAVSVWPTPALAGQVVSSQSFGPSCCSCGLSSLGVSAAAFCPLDLLSHPVLLLFLAWVSSFGVCLGLGLKAAVLSWILPSLGGGGGGGLSFPCPRCFRLAFPTVLLSRLLGFLGLFAGVSFFSLQVFADSSGWLADSPWLSALRCLATGGVTLFLCRACRLALVGLRCLWVPRSCGVQGLRDGVTCLRSGLCSSSVHDRNEDFPSLWWVWFLAFVLGSPISGRSCVLWPAVVPEAIPPSGGIGPAPSRWVPLLGAKCVWGLPPFARNGGVASASPVYSFGMWSPFGSSVSFIHS